MDDIYKNKSKNEIIEAIYDNCLQNTNGREDNDEMFKKGIEACYEELCEGITESNEPQAATCNIPHVSNSLDGKRKVSHTTIPNACPECGGDVHDGTGTGWEICKDCGWMC